MVSLIWLRTSSELGRFCTSATAKIAPVISSELVEFKMSCVVA